MEYTYISWFIFVCVFIQDNNIDSFRNDNDLSKKNSKSLQNFPSRKFLKKNIIDRVITNDFNLPIPKNSLDSIYVYFYSILWSQANYIYKFFGIFGYRTFNGTRDYNFIKTEYTANLVKTRSSDLIYFFLH